MFRLLDLAQPVGVAQLGKVLAKLIADEKLELFLRQEPADPGAHGDALRRHVRLLVPAEDAHRGAVLRHLTEVIPICIERVQRAPLRRVDRRRDGMEGV
jgi:hypothetical protein